MKSKKRIVLAYSGGLDTSIILKWLQEKYDAEQRRKRTADPNKTHKRLKSMERVERNVNKLRNMTPEQKYARKMRIKQQQKDKK